MSEQLRLKDCRFIELDNVDFTLDSYSKYKAEYRRSFVFERASRTLYYFPIEGGVYYVIAQEVYLPAYEIFKALKRAAEYSEDGKRLSDNIPGSIRIEQLVLLRQSFSTEEIIALKEKGLLWTGVLRSSF